MSTIDDQRIWLERIMSSATIGFVVQQENGALLQCVDGDPKLRLALIEWQTQRIREMERSQRPAQPVTYPTREQPVLSEGSGGQAGDNQAFADACGELAWRTTNAGRNQSAVSSPPSFPGS